MCVAVNVAVQLFGHTTKCNLTTFGSPGGDVCIGCCVSCINVVVMQWCCEFFGVASCLYVQIMRTGDASMW